MSNTLAWRDTILTRCYPLDDRPIDRLGEWLVRRGLISRVELFTALDAAYRHSCRLGDALVWLDVLDRGRVELEASRFARFANRGDAGNIQR